MVWPFKKDDSQGEKEKRKFRGLGKGKMGANKLPDHLRKDNSEKKRIEELVEEVEGDWEEVGEGENIPELSDDLSDLTELRDSATLQDPLGEKNFPPAADEEDPFGALEDIDLANKGEDMEYPLKDDGGFDDLDDLGDFDDLDNLDDFDELGDFSDDDDLDDVDEISIDDDMKKQKEKEKEEVIPSSRGMGTMRLEKRNLKPPSKSAQKNRQSQKSRSKKALSQDQIQLAEALIAGGTVTREELARELESIGKKDGVLGKALLNTGYVSREKLYPILLSKYRIPKLNIKNTKIPRSTLEILSSEEANKLRIIPIEKIGNIICVAMDQITNLEAIEEFRQLTGCKISVIQCDKEGMDFTLKRYYSKPSPAKRPEAKKKASTPKMAPTGATKSARKAADATPATIKAIPVSPGELSGAGNLESRFLNVAARWKHIHIEGKKVVPEEARM